VNSNQPGISPACLATLATVPSEMESPMEGTEILISPANKAEDWKLRDRLLNWLYKMGVRLLHNSLQNKQAIMACIAHSKQ